MDDSRWDLKLVIITLVVLLAVMAGIASARGTQANIYHGDLCAARLSLLTDTLAVIRDDEFCLRVITP